MFSVRSAYRIHIELQQRQSHRPRGECSLGIEEDRKMWLDLWRVRCPGKIHHFMWRVAHNSHPMLRNVERIGVNLDNACVICHRLPEDGGHLFLRFKEVKKVWRACQLEETRLELLECPTPRQLLRRVFSLNEDVKLRVICLMWLWWSERNKANHKKTRASVQDFQFLVTKHVVEWREFSVLIP